MIFSSWAFALFFTVVILGLLVSPSRNYRSWFLLAASLFFYGYWDVRFLPLILFTTWIDFEVGKYIHRSKSSRFRRWLLAASVVANLGVLGIFKYANFLLTTANALFVSTGWHFRTLDIVLPLGISFFTFQSMNYTIDIYRNKLAPTKRYRDFLFFVSFFPHLIAGPLVRAANFLPQVARPVTLRWRNFESGIWLFSQGLVKKLLIADRIAFFVDPVFSDPASYSGSTLLLAVIAYSIQIYCDFSGYSDMAIALARSLGFTFPENFRMPYLSLNVTEFWQRWHITLSNWLRDYLYISLGGNRKGKRRTYVNLFITMALGGLWHGASWNFVIWGVLHGSALALHRMLSRDLKTPLLTHMPNWLAWLLTYAFVCFCWVFFRAPTLVDAALILRKIVTWDSYGVGWYYTGVLLWIPVIILANWIGRHKGLPQLSLTSFRGAFALLMIVLALIAFAPLQSSPFIYFQF
ncbi:MAG TPA: MBOAT family O-acyltransferase [Bdellovibrionota bacterium]|nr:MBOAT family O-acyltransferase [Bdellovibrionota bacterium]